VNHPNPLLDGILDLTVAVHGLGPELVISNALTEASIGGFKADGRTLRGALTTARNPFNVSVRMSHTVLDLFLHEPINYTLDSLTWGRVSCATDRYARAAFAKGMRMYPYLCDGKHCPADQMRQDWVDIGPASTASFFSPAGPVPGQTAIDPRTGQAQKCPGAVVALLQPKDMDCCYLSLHFALSCRAMSRGEAHFHTRTNGTARLALDGSFVVESVVVQDDVFFSFDRDMVDGFRSGGDLDCSQIAIAY